MKFGCVSIILPAFNSGKRIKRAINSVMKQTYSNWELIIINDASTDNTLSYISEIEDERIIIINNKKNLGLADSRNKGLRIIKGEYITFLDADDWIDKDILKKSISTLKNEKSDAVVYDIQSVYNNHVTITKCKPHPFESYPSVWNKVYKAELWKNCWFSNNGKVEDFQIVPIILLKAKKISKIENSYYYYVQSSDSLVHSYSDPKEQLKILDDVNLLLSKLSRSQIIRYNNSLRKYINYQLSEHFWKGIEDSKSTDEIKELFVRIAEYSKQMNETMFNNSDYFFSDSLYHFFRNLIILRLFSLGMYKSGRNLYIKILRIKGLRKK